MEFVYISGLLDGAAWSTLQHLGIRPPLPPLDTTHDTIATQFNDEMDCFLFELHDDSLDNYFSSEVFDLSILSIRFLDMNPFLSLQNILSW